MNFKIPLASPDLRGNEEKYVCEAIRSGWIGTGQFINQFESEYARLCGTRTAIACANGTVALHLALLALDVKPGDEVIVPSFTYVATANAVRYCGAEPVFIDVQPDTWCMNPDCIEPAITSRTRGIIPVHLYGHPADMDPINDIAKKYKLWVIEDAAEAALAQYKGKSVGGLSDVATFSFHITKVFTSGEGGALTLSDERLESLIRLMYSHGMDSKRRFYFPIVGYNYRLTNLSAAILCAQIERHESLLERRHEIFRIYTDMLRDTPGISLRPIASWAKLSPWLFSITVDTAAFGHSREVLMSTLAQNGIDSRPFFIPVHTLPAFNKSQAESNMDLSLTNQLCRSGVNLPTYTTMTDDQVEDVCNTIKRMVN